MPTLTSDCRAHVMAILWSAIAIGCAGGQTANATASADVLLDSQAETQEPPVTTGPVALIDNALWEPVAPADDPFYPADDADVVLCDEDAYETEFEAGEFWFSVSTEDCNYLTVRQPLVAAAPAGASLQVRLWHFTITVGEGNYTHVIAAGETLDTLWSTELPIPTESGGLLPFDLVPLPRDLTAGEPVYWHLRNHGQNSWHLIEVSANQAL